MRKIAHLKGPVWVTGNIELNNQNGLHEIWTKLEACEKEIKNYFYLSHSKEFVLILFLLTSV